MAEKLAELRQKGGSDNSIDLMAPDIMSYRTINGNSTYTVTVTQKPRLITILDLVNGNSNLSQMNIYDVEQNKTYQAAKISSGDYQGVWSGMATRISSVSASAVVLTNPSSSARTFYYAIYY